MLTPVPQFDLLFSMKSKEDIIRDYIRIYIENAETNNRLEDAFRHIGDLDDENQKLKDRIAELEKRPKKPKIRDKKRSNSKESRGKISEDGKTKRTDSEKDKRKTSLKIHNTVVLQPETIPESAKLKAYKDYIVQDIQIMPVNTLYRRAVYVLPNGKLIYGKLPGCAEKSHFGIPLRAFIINEYYGKRVTQGLIHENLTDLGIIISKAEISEILSSKTTEFESDYKDILKSGLTYSNYLHVDDTGSRHSGKSGYCTVLGNEAFAWYKSGKSKSKANFLRLLSPVIKQYTYNSAAMDYLQQYKIKLPFSEKIFNTKYDLKSYLKSIGIKSKYKLRIIQEAGLVGTIDCYVKDISRINIMSDNAKQFNVFNHMQCYIHIERNIKKYSPSYHVFKDEQDYVLELWWSLYRSIKDYKEFRDEYDKESAEKTFEKLGSLNIQYEHLKKEVDFIVSHKSEFLRPLYDPVLPLHNNLCENDVRQYVMKRNISGETKSESGQKARDIFLSIKTTCRKCNVNFIDYLKSRMGKSKLVPSMHDIVFNRILQLGIQDDAVTFAL